MEKIRTFAIECVLLLIVQFSTCEADRPCWAERLNENRSIVCQCTPDYCDELIRQEPSYGNFISYTSSEDGRRFQKTVNELPIYYYQAQPGACITDDCFPALYLNTSVAYQTVEGFGGAITDAAGINWLSMEDEQLRKHLIDSYFSKQGLEYNMIRVPIGGSDFSTHPYAYNEYPENDATLSNYTLAPEDHYYKLPMIRECLDTATSQVHVLATLWSPPAWMKTNNALHGLGQLKEEYYQTYADYFLHYRYACDRKTITIIGGTNAVTKFDDLRGRAVFKVLPAVCLGVCGTFIVSDFHNTSALATYFGIRAIFLYLYAKEGVPIWGVTTTNEPTNGVIGKSIKFNSLGWSIGDLGNWIAYNLGPTLRGSEFKEVKILAVDDQRHYIIPYFYLLTLENKKALEYIDGVGVHFYFDRRVPPELITRVMGTHPDKFIMSTEACAGFEAESDSKVDLGSWQRAELYIKDIIEDLNYNFTGWIDWNMCLDEQGGPNWVNNFVDSPIIISDDKQKFYKQPMYYALAHVTKFLPRGSRRIHVQVLCQKTVDHVAFVTPYNTIVTILYNSGETTRVDLITCHRQATIEVEKNSVTTVEFIHERCINER